MGFRGPGLTLAVACAATGLMVTSVTGVFVTLPQIGSDLGAGLSSLQWVVNGFTLALATGMLIAGSLGDRYGHAQVLAAGVAIVGVTSLIAGLAGSALFLIIARVGCGIGASVVFACSLALLAVAFPGEERRRAMERWGLAVGLGTAAGCLLGGGLSDWPSWRWMFVLVGLGMLPIVPLAARLHSQTTAARRLDWPGILAFAAGLFLILLALTDGNEYGWLSTRTLVLFAAGVGCLVVLRLVERGTTEPAIDPELLRSPSFRASAIGSVVLFATQTAGWIYIVMLLRESGYSPLQIGLQSLPMALMAIAGSLACQRVRSVAPHLLAAPALLLVATGLMICSGAVQPADWLWLTVGFVLMGGGFGLAQPALVAAALQGASPAKSGMASGLNTTFRQLGVVIGVAGFGAMFDGPAGLDGMLLVATAVTVAGALFVMLTGDQAQRVPAAVKRPLQQPAAPN